VPVTSGPSEVAGLLLADGRLPVGGYAHSAGLEAAVADGLDVESVPDYIGARLRTVALVEAAGAVLAHRRCRQPDRLGELDSALAARTPDAALRAASAQLGRGITRLVTRRFPDHPVAGVLAGLGRDVLRPIPFGALAALCELPEAETARLSLYGDAQTVASASLKLLPIDPVDTVGWVLDAADAIAEATDRAIAVTSVDDLPAYGAPMTEHYARAHSHRTRRIFVA
jgi:urease accessory protein